MLGRRHRCCPGRVKAAPIGRKRPTLEGKALGAAVTPPEREYASRQPRFARCALPPPIAHRLWRMSLDQNKDIGFEARRRIATVADELENLAEAVEDELPVEL